MQKAGISIAGAVSGLELKEYLKTSLVDLVAKQIRAGIFTGRYLPGKKLIVRELSEEFGVSHTPVKDALNRLTAEGLVDACPGHSMVVRSFTNDEMIESMGVRLMCEIFHADAIVRNTAGNPALIEELDSLWQAMRNLLEIGDGFDPESWVNYETRFHRSYMAVCGNKKLIEIYNALDANRFTYFAYLYNNNVPLGQRTYELNMAEHREIIDALKECSADRFKRAVARHVVRACGDYEVDEVTRGKIDLIKITVNRYLSEGMEQERASVLFALKKAE
ncbi:MAG: GntR family transcriptional regulator [Desulfovibrio sp.]|jgi:DNA-binding GntR family transcriptional regulator|nr:GntR family transcriptional regulator [Desulfovibrio sp.]